MFGKDLRLIQASVQLMGGLSGAKEGKLLEGIVPSVLLSYNGDKLETDFSGAWYKSVRNYDNKANDSF